MNAVQVAFVSFCVATVFFRTHLKKHDLNDGNKYLGLTFQALVRFTYRTTLRPQMPIAVDLIKTQVLFNIGAPDLHLCIPGSSVRCHAGEE